MAGEVARGYKAVAYAYRLWQGVLLGWDVYLSVARGRCRLRPWAPPSPLSGEGGGEGPFVNNIIGVTKIKFLPHTVYKDVVAAFLYGWGMWRSTA